MSFGIPYRVIQGGQPIVYGSWPSLRARILPCYCDLIVFVLRPADVSVCLSVHYLTSWVQFILLGPPPFFLPALINSCFAGTWYKLSAVDECSLSSFWLRCSAHCLIAHGHHSGMPCCMLWSAEFYPNPCLQGVSIVISFSGSLSINFNSLLVNFASSHLSVLHHESQSLNRIDFFWLANIDDSVTWKLFLVLSHSNDALYGMLISRFIEHVEPPCCL